MSLVTNLGSMLLNTRRASNAEFGMMQTSNRMINRIGQIGANPSFGMSNIKMLHEQEKDDMTRLQTLNLMRRLSRSMAEAAEKRIKAEKLDYYA